MLVYSVFSPVTKDRYMAEQLHKRYALVLEGKLVEDCVRKKGFV
jgi:hypothetical protein